MTHPDLGEAIDLILDEFAERVAHRIVKRLREQSSDGLQSLEGRDTGSDVQQNATSEATTPNAKRSTDELIAILQSGGQLTEEEERRMRVRREMIATLARGRQERAAAKTKAGARKGADRNGRD